MEEWSRALVGVGATMAPRSQLWNGICAAFVRPATESSRIGKMSTAAWVVLAVSMNAASESSIPPKWSMMRAARKARPPIMLRLIWRKEFLMASSVRVYPIMRNEQTVVISQPVKSHSRLSESTMTNIAERKMNMSALKKWRRSGAPAGS